MTDKPVMVDEVVLPEEQQRLYAGRFYRCTGKLPVGEVRQSFRWKNNHTIYVGLEANVSRDPENPRVVFTPVSEKHLDRNLYNSRGQLQYGTHKEYERDAGPDEEQSGTS